MVPLTRPNHVDQTPFGPAHNPGERSALNELNAMHAIAEALAEVPEEETRARVLAWAIRLFAGTHGVDDNLSRETPKRMASATSSPPARADGVRPVERLETTSLDEPARESGALAPGRPRTRRPLLRVRFMWRRSRSQPGPR